KFRKGGGCADDGLQTKCDDDLYNRAAAHYAQERAGTDRHEGARQALYADRPAAARSAGPAGLGAAAGIHHTRVPGHETADEWLASAAGARRRLQGGRDRPAQLARAAAA